MLKNPSPRQHTLEMVILEDLVPTDHLLRKIDKYIDFEFIRDQVRHLYCDNNGRPAVDPVLLFKMLFIGYLFGVRSERQLVREVQVNVAYRWFLGLSLTDNIIDASTFSQQRRRRFLATDIEQQIFDEIVRQAIQHGLVGGDVLYTDSTHMKANANKKKFEIHTVTQTPTDYLTALEVAIDEDRIAHGKAPLKTKVEDIEPKEREIKVSTTDPDSGYLTREGKPQGFYYLDHRTVDGKYNIITDTHVTPGNVHDSKPYLARLDRQLTAFNIYPECVGLDAGCKTAGICKGLEERGIEGVIGYRRPNKKEGYFCQTTLCVRRRQQSIHLPGRPVNSIQHHQSIGLSRIPFRFTTMPRVSVSGSMHTQPQPDKSDYTARVARQCRAHRRATINGKR
jgi:transposase